MFEAWMGEEMKRNGGGKAGHDSLSPARKRNGHARLEIDYRYGVFASCCAVSHVRQVIPIHPITVGGFGHRLAAIGS